MSETTLRNPTLAQVNAELTRLAELANRGQRSRMATLSVSESEWANSEFAACAGGAGVPNSYQQRAYTTIVSVAWVTDLAGDRYVRVDARRTNAPKSSFARSRRYGFDLTQRQWENSSILSLALPEVILVKAAAPQFDFADDDDKPLNVVALLVACDWLQEQGKSLDLVARIRGTFRLPLVTA